MNSILWASLGIALGCLVPFIYKRWQRQSPEAPARRRPGAPQAARAPAPASRPRSRGPAAPQVRSGLNRKQARRFHGVSIKPGPHACQAVQELVGQRFLPDEAPAMPLPGCDQARCQCGYGHHGDRRDAEDRRSGWGTFGGFAPSVPGGNRRGKAPDRRGGDD